MSEQSKLSSSATERPDHGRVCKIKKQKIFLIRHGVAQHNLPDPRTRQLPDLTNPALTDPPLVPHGENQARYVGERLRYYFSSSSSSCQGGTRSTKKKRDNKKVVKGDVSDEDQGEMDVNGIDLVVASPLTRCLQTACLAFLSPERQLRVPFYCHEDVREAYGMHYPDRRRRKSFLKSYWPYVEFHLNMTEEDKVWKPDSRECLRDVVYRIIRFFQWLSIRPEKCIAIVSHGVWIECCLMYFCPESLDNGRRRVYNCDVYHGEFVTTWDDDDDAVDNDDDDDDDGDSSASRENRKIRLQNMKILE